MFPFDDTVSIPAEAIEYIEKIVGKSPYKNMFYFEIIELFFEWLVKQDIETQRSVLKEALNSGKRICGKFFEQQ